MNPLAPPSSDLSVILLNKLFGAGWTNFAGNPSGFLQTVLSVFDSAMFAVLGVIAVYSLVMGIAEAAHDGVPLGKRYSKWMPFRMVAAGAFLAPVANGISIVQALVLYVAGAGIGVADDVWNAGTTYLIKSGPAIVMNTETGVGLAKDALNSLVCMAWVNSQYQYLGSGSQTGLPTTGPISSSTASGAASTSVGPSLPPLNGPFVQINSTSTTYTVNGTSPLSSTNYFGGPPNAAVNQVITDIVSFDGVSGSGLPPGICGRFLFSYNSSLPAASAVSSAQSSALTTMLTSLTPLAQQLVPSPGTPASSTPAAPSPTTLFNAVNTYQTTVSGAAAAAASAGTNAATLSQWLSTAQEGGWLTAGSFYYSFSKENQQLSDLVGKKWTYEGPAVESIADPSMGTAYSLKNTMAGTAGYEKVLDQVGTFVGNPPTAANIAAATGNVSENGDGVFSKVLELVSTPVTGFLTGIGNFLAQHGDPMLTAQSVGMASIDAGEGILAAAAVAFSVEKAAEGEAKAVNRIPLVGGVIGAVVNPLIGAANGLGEIGLPIVLGVTLFLITFGATLAYVLPFMPFLYWVFGVWNWVLLLIEGLVAVPLWGIAHAKPEGEGFLSQESQRGYMNLLLIFLMPTIMVFGFFASFEILDVLASLIFDGWSAMIGSVTAGSLTGIVGVLTLLGIFNILMIGSAKKIFHYTLITFPQWVLSWANIQGEASHGDVPGMREEPGEAMKTIERAAGSYAGNVAADRKEAAREARIEAKKSKGGDSNDSSSSPGGGGGKPSGGSSGGGDQEGKPSTSVSG